ncbi:MAG: endonuclease MutS2 [Acetobacteraceae bacterium]|nr:endonuclease MutS2 [Acetobacteraceae bacterium]
MAEVDPHTLEALEYGQVLERLADRAESALGRELARALAPTASLEEARARQAETTQAVRLLSGPTIPPGGGIHDLRGEVARARAGATLGPLDFLRLADTLRTARRLKQFLGERESDAPLLAGLAQGVQPLPDLEEALRSAIAPDGEVADQASPELSAIRRQKAQLLNRVRDRMEELARSPGLRDYLQEPLVTLREDRYVLPVKQEHRARVPGVVHDRSASGLTLFVEPLEVVELNNELRQKALEEREEVERVLRELSGRVGGAAGDILGTLDVLGRLDLALAKGRLSLDMGGVEPALNASQWLELKAARHPLLRGRVVPIDLHLGRRFRTLVLTGPNTGGKTVTLKTVGLLTLMAQAGLHVPAAPGTEIPVLSRIFCDIGDEQSIEQSLSTFSAHLRNLVPLVEQAGRDTLVLIDEIGAGTDPQEGSALAMALLDHLHGRGGLTIATTHFSQLKTFAFSRDGMENASVEFDPLTLQPTFRVVMGLPGRSNALEVAARLGLSPEVLGRAREFMSRQELEVEGLIAELMAQRDRLERAAAEAEDARRRAEALLRQVQERQAAQAARLREALEGARDRARELLRRARVEAAEALKAFHRSLAEARERGDLAGAARGAAEVRGRLEGLRREVESLPGGPEEAEPAPEEAAGPRLEPGEIEPGRAVYLPMLRQRGYVAEPPGRDGLVKVQVGAVKVQVPAGELRAADGAPPPPRPAEPVLALDKAREISPQLSIRGLTVEEALAALDKYLDDACLAGLEQVRIIHGKGTGALRAAVAEYLSSHPRVEGFRLGEPAEGAEGVTVARLRR